MRLVFPAHENMGYCGKDKCIDAHFSKIGKKQRQWYLYGTLV